MSLAVNQRNGRRRNGYDIPSESSANRKLSGFDGGIRPVKSASRQEIKPEEMRV